MTLAERAQAIQRVCFDRSPSEVDLELLGSRERWLVYRDLVRGRLTHVVGVALRRTKQAVGDGAFERLIDEWLSRGGPNTRYLRHVPSELAAFALSSWHWTGPAWAPDLARYEIAAWEVRQAPPEPQSHEAFGFDRKPVVRRAMRLLRLDHPVHQSPMPAAGYPPAPTLLCVYRNTKHESVTRKLNALAADLLESWQRAEETVAQSVERIAAEHETPVSPIFIEKLSSLVAEFVLGGQSHS
ncbi:MAG: putative DNA-binding domain-containing protein [Myxococcales bacterium]|jgi:hypothetical protein